MDALPVLLPSSALPRVSTNDWTPTRHTAPPHPPPPDEQRTEIALAAARQLIDGKALKKTRPRRTVDYGGAMGRWILNRRCRPNPRYVPYIRPAPPCIIDLLPPAGYPTNPSTSLTTKFIHTSTNKIRCPVNCVAWTPEGRRVLTGSTSGEFTLWNGLTFNFETILQAHDSAVRALSFSRSGAYLASADQTGIIKYFQPNMNNLTAWQGHREAVRDISFSPDDARFATASDDSTVRIWNFEESKEERVLSGHGWDVRCVQWHPSKGLLASGSKDNLVKFWDPRTGTCLSTLHHHKNTIQALSWSPDGGILATGSRDQTIRLFDIRAMKEFRILRGHKKEVCSLTWHPIHPILVSGGSEGSILYWDVDSPASVLANSSSQSSTAVSQATEGPRATLAQAHDSNVWSLAFHPLGHILVSASNDHTTRFWARERPGDAGSTFSGGGIRPPEGVAEEDDDAEDDGDGMAVPGLSWWGKEEDANAMPMLPGFSGASAAAAAAAGASASAVGNTSTTSEDGIPGIPGFGRTSTAPPTQQVDGRVGQRQDDSGYMDHNGGGGVNGEWGGNQGGSSYYGGGYRERGGYGGRGGFGGGRGSRWGPRRGGRH